MTKALATQTPAGLPDLAPTPAVDLDGGDIQLPRLYVGTSTSAHVQAGHAGVGQIYSATSKDDDEPEILFDPKGKAASADGVLVHVLAVSKCKALWEDGSKQRWNMNDPEAPADAWREYEFTLCLPDVDPDIPFRLTCTKSALSTAKKINTVLARGAGRGPAYLAAFLLTTKQNKNDKGTWYTPVASTATASDAGIAASGALVAALPQPEQIAMATVESTATGDEPEI